MAPHKAVVVVKPATTTTTTFVMPPEPIDQQWKIPGPDVDMDRDYIEVGAQ